MGEQLTFDTAQLSALVANFYAADPDVQQAAKAAVRSAGDAMYEIAHALCAVDTGFMRSQLTERVTEGGYAVSVGWSEDVFLAAGLSFYPPFVELGTRFMAAQPAIGPAFDLVMPEFEADMALILETAIARRLAR